MADTRASEYGRNLAVWVEFTLYSIPTNRRKDYVSRFLKELNNFSVEPRKRGTPRNSGCVYELEDIVDLEISNPEHLAKLIKEGMHLMYQKRTASKVLDSLTGYFSQKV